MHGLHGDRDGNIGGTDEMGMARDGVTGEGPTGMQRQTQKAKEEGSDGVTALQPCRQCRNEV